MKIEKFNKERAGYVRLLFMLRNQRRADCHRIVNFSFPGECEDQRRNKFAAACTRSEFIEMLLTDLGEPLETFDENEGLIKCEWEGAKK